MSLTQANGYLAIPPTGKGKAVLVLHAWWGLNDTIKAFCTRLAEEGFIAFAPDLYHGKVTDKIAEAENLSSALLGNLPQAQADLDAAIALLKEHPAASDASLAVIGFSLGAYYALELSATKPDIIQSVVLFYGTRPGDYSHSKAAYLGHFAETDEFEPLTEVNNLEESLKRAGRQVEFHHYSGTGHWFFESDRVDAYNESAATLAWERTIAFLKR